jgi:presenilin-like A22 family membrane protease
MKHTLKITILFMVLFIIAQLVGTYSLELSIKDVSQVNGTTQISYFDTAIGERPDTTGYESVIYILLGIAIGTIIILIFAKYRQVDLWKIWFFLAVFISVGISVGVFLQSSSLVLIWIVALVLTIWKIFYPNIFIQNITELLMYSGIAILLSPIFNVLWMFVLLVIISIYDIYAVWKSKHMVKMAEFTSEANLFPGLTLSYKVENGKTKLYTRKMSAKIAGQENVASSEGKTGVLGGGDVVFPLLFSGTVMFDLILSGMSRISAFWYVQIITLTTAVALFLLFYFSKKGKFYPAMPVVTAGCVVGYLIILIV